MWITIHTGLAFARFGRQGRGVFQAGPSSVSSAPRCLAPQMSINAPQVSINKIYPHCLPTAFGPNSPLCQLQIDASATELAQPESRELLLEQETFNVPQQETEKIAHIDDIASIEDSEAELMLCQSTQRKAWKTILQVPSLFLFWKMVPAVLRWPLLALFLRMRQMPILSSRLSQIPLKSLHHPNPHLIGLTPLLSLCC